MSQNVRNFTHSSNFVFTTTLFGEETSYKLQGMNLPGVSFSHIQISRSAVFGNMQGDTVTYSPLNMQFIVDENLEIWKELVGVIQKMRNPETSEGFLNEKYGILEIHDDNSKKVMSLEFTDVMLESIGDLDFSTITDDEILTLDVSVSYDYYTVTSYTEEEN